MTNSDLNYNSKNKLYYLFILFILMSSCFFYKDKIKNILKIIIIII